MAANIDKVIKLVDVLLSGGKLLRAKQVLLENLKTNPQNTKLTELLASIYRTEGNSDKSLELLIEVSSNPDLSLESYCNLGLLCLKKEKSDEALYYFEKATEKFKGSFEAHFYLAIALAAKKKYQQEKKEFGLVSKCNFVQTRYRWRLGFGSKKS